MKASVFPAVLGLLLATVASAASVTGRSETFQGQVLSTSCDAIGRIDGILLTNGTYLRFHPGSFDATARIQPEDHLTVTGRTILSAPNRVVTRLLVKKEGATVVDDVPIFANAESAPIITSQSAQADSKYVYRDSSNVEAVGATSDRRGDRLILDGGLTVEIPPGASIELASRLIGLKVTIVGAATSASGGRYVVAMSVKDESGKELLMSSERDAHWVLARGTIKSVKTDAKGKIESLSLADGKTVAFAMPFFPFSPADALVAGAAIELSGLLSDNTIDSRMIIILATNTVVDTKVSVIGRRGRR